MIDDILSAGAALVKETGWTWEQIMWQMPCAHLFLTLDYWPSLEEDNE